MSEYHKREGLFIGKYQPQPSEFGYFSALKLAKRTRNLTISGCQETVKKADAKITMAIIAIGAAARQWMQQIAAAAGEVEPIAPQPTSLMERLVTLGI